MKTQLLRIAVFAMALLAALAALAQGPSGTILVNIPFEFVVGNHHMQPGRYMVSRTANGFLYIHDTEVADNHMFLPVQSTYSNAPSDPKLVFHRYGNTYFLAEIWNGSEVGKEVLKSQAEKEILARLKGSPSKSEVAVLRPER